MSAVQYIDTKQPFLFENGKSIDTLRIAYHTYGKLNAERNNVIWVFHATTANSDVMSWWPGLFGETCLYNPSEYFIVCANTIGSPYGSSMPKNLEFPQFTIRDVVKAHNELAKFLGITRIHTAIGGSFGGSQAMEFVLAFKGHVERLVVLACAARETAWGIAIHEAQRLALQADATFGTCNGGKNGLKAARAIGMLTYRTHRAFVETQTDEMDKVDDFKAASYIQYQGQKLVNRFDALSYYYLCSCLDTHNLGRNRGGVKRALHAITCPTLAIGIDSDQLLPVYLQKDIAKHVQHGEYVEITSDYGHDGFLIETKQISEVIQAFYNNEKSRS